MAITTKKIWETGYLKKVLALVMVFAMMATAMFSAAAFTDDADIIADDAVQMLTALGVINGYEDGSFQPNGTVTRAEMAAMIYIIRNGGNKDASAYENLPTSFTDLDQASWAKGYIKFCQSAGLVSGRSDKIFDPNATVTGVEAALMCLRVAGLDVEKAGIGGATWANKTMAMATQKGITDDYAVSLSEGAPRQWAAQLLYNTLFTANMIWSEDAQNFIDETTYDYTTGNGVTANLVKVTVGAKYMGLKEYTGTYIGNEDNALSSNDGRIQVGSKYATYDLGLDWVGEEVTVLYKESKDGVTNLDYKDTVYGVFNTGKSKAFTCALSDVRKIDTAKDTIKISDVTYDYDSSLESGTPVLVNYRTSGSIAFSEAALKVNSSDTLKLVCNPSTGKIDTVYMFTSTPTKVLSVTSDKIMLKGIGAVEIKDTTAYEGIAKDDFVNYASYYNTNKTILTKADTVTGKIEAYKADTTKGAQVMIDGTWYKPTTSGRTADAYNISKDTDYTLMTNATYTIGDEYKLLMSGSFYAGAKKVDGTRNYAVVTGTDTSFNDKMVKMLLADGSEVTATIDSDGAVETAEEGKVYLYELLSSNTKVKLTNVSNGGSSNITSNSGISYDKDTKSFCGTPVSTDAVAFIKSTTNNKWKVYDATSLSDIASANVVGDDTNFISYNIEDGKVEAFAMVMNQIPTSSGDTSVYGYVVDKYTAKDDKDNNITTLEVWDGTEVKKVIVDGTSVAAVKGNFIKAPLSSSAISNSEIEIATVGQVVKIKDYTSIGQLITTTSTYQTNGTWTGGADTTYKVTADTKIIGVKSSGAKASESADAIVVADLVAGKDYKNAVIFLGTGDEATTVEAIFVDEDNAIDFDGTGSGTPSI